MEKINFNVSNTKEFDLVGNIKFYSGEIIDYYSEEKMLNAYKDAINLNGVYGVRAYNILPKGVKERHGLRYEMHKAIMKEFNFDFTKEDYLEYLEYKERESREYQEFHNSHR